MFNISFVNFLKLDSSSFHDGSNVLSLYLTGYQPLKAVSNAFSVAPTSNSNVTIANMGEFVFDWLTKFPPFDPPGVFEKAGNLYSGIKIELCPTVI